MSELPHTDDVPRPIEGQTDGLDADRIEEAFSSFAERVRELESVAHELRSELRALRAERAPGRAFADDEDWPVEPGASSSKPASSPHWVAAVPPPLARPTAVPRLVAEGAFLVAVALLAGLADLGAAWIVLVMAAAWALVALSEWAAAAKRARWHLDQVAPSVAAPTGAELDTTGPWDMPVVHATVVEVPDESESRTMVAKLPAPPESAPADDQVAEVTEPAEPARRGFRFRRRPPVETTPDPWEA
jgi:hypothetical protein